MIVIGILLLSALLVLYTVLVYGAAVSYGRREGYWAGYNDGVEDIEVYDSKFTVHREPKVLDTETDEPFASDEEIESFKFEELE